MSRIGDLMECLGAPAAFTSAGVQLMPQSCTTVMDLSVEEDMKRLVRRMNILLILVAVELIPIALLAAYCLVMFLPHPIAGPGD